MTQCGKGPADRVIEVLVAEVGCAPALRKVLCCLQAAQENMEQEILNDSVLLMNAQDRAKKLIENYFKQLEKISGSDFIIRWDFAENQTAETIPES